MNDASAVRACLAGDAAAFATLVDRHAPVCLRFATRMLGSREDAEDVVQDALLRAHRALRSFDTTRDFRTWLMSIVANRCRTALVARRRRERWLVDASLERAASTVAAEREDGGALRSIEWALERLDARHREAFLLKHVEGLSYLEMETITGAGVSALKMRVRRACEQLRQLLKTEEHAHPDG